MTSNQNVERRSATCEPMKFRLTLDNYTATRLELEASARRALDVVGTGKIKVTLDLADIATAHARMGERRTTGSNVFTSRYWVDL